MADKKVRLRKAPSSVNQAEAAGVNAKVRPSQSKFRAAKKLLFLILRPLKIVSGPLHWLVPTYFKNAWREVKQVSWPNRRETWRLTLAVFIFAIVFGLAVAGVDKVLDLLFKKVILKQ